MAADRTGLPPAAANQESTTERHPRLGRVWENRRQLLRSPAVAFALLAAMVVAFAGAWAGGDLLIDGPGIAVYVQVGVDHLSDHGRLWYWLPEMWAGTPVWALAPSFPVLLLLPLAAVVGSVTAVKAAIIVFQVLGAWGAYLLARSLWEHLPAALVAGVVYGLSPLVISHGALAGSETALGVMAATPWIVWSLRRGLRGDGRRFLVTAALFTAFAVLQEAEFAYGLAVLGVCLVVSEARRLAVTGTTTREYLGRCALVVAVTLGALAHWLLPFLALHKSFVLSPQVLVEGELLSGIGNTVGRELGIFWHRSTLTGVVTPDRVGLIGQVLYLGRVSGVITVVTAFLLARRNDDRTTSAVLLASALSLWVSTGAVTLATGGPTERGRVIHLLVTGVVAGLLAGSFLRRLRLGRWTAPVGLAVAAFLFVAPYLSPFLILQRGVPLLSHIRFPRFYVLAMLGLALGSAWPVAHVRRWLPATLQRRAGLIGAIAATVVVAAVLVDVWPYRSFYRLKNPPSARAYREAFAELAGRPPDSRIANGSLDPRIVTSLRATGADLSLGWPHPVAGKQLWRVTVEALLGPAGYGYRALGLSASTAVTKEEPLRKGTDRQAVREVKVLHNPVTLPRVRAYDRVLMVEDGSITPELAVALAHRNVGVVRSRPHLVDAMADLALPSPVPSGACTRPAASLPLDVAGEVGIACAMHPWLETTLSGPDLFGPERTPGAVFTAMADGLRGVSVWFRDPPGESELVLREVAPDGRAGPEVLRTRATAVDEYSMVVFGFQPIESSRGRRYQYNIECPTCFTELEPQVVTGRDINDNGNLLLRGQLLRNHLAAFAPVYARLAPSPPTRTTVRARQDRPGRWTVETSGSQPALVVVSEAYFPGWRAEVDGRRTPAAEADGAFVGVPVEAGDHRITLTYDAPPAALVGRAITGLTLLAIAAGGLRSRRRNRRHALEMGAPARQPGGEEVLGPGEGVPGPAVAGRKDPGGEGDETVLSTVDDLEPGRLDRGEEGGGGEP